MQKFSQLKKNYSIENSAKFYQETTKKNVGMVNNKQGTSFENFKFKSARLNKKFPGGANIFEGAAQAVGFAAGKATESHKGFVEYMTWQQGRSGTLDIISTTMGEGGKLNTKSRDYMLNNVSDSQRTTLKGLNDKELSKEWLKIQYKKWESK